MEFNEVLERYGINDVFTLDVKEEVDKISDSITAKEKAKRTDLTEELIITIDGDDAKDLDDAISCKALKGGKYLLGVHIADVSHYVKEGGAIDQTASERGTSVYFPGTVVPMLPKRLSNGVCSLNANEPKLTLTCFMTITKNGGVVDYSICESIINSHDRMTYNKVSAILEGDMALRHEYAHLIPMLEDMRTLALILRDKRARRGSLDFDFPETKVIMEGGSPAKVEKYEIGLSNHIIEEFMLCANETVAKHIFDKDFPLIYRVHEDPDEEKIEKLKAVVNSMGYKLKNKSKTAPKALQNILFSLSGKVEKKAISTIMLRCMMKARYSSENLGHYGLAADYYCHFTSPIRRYPDLFVHRVLNEEIKGNGSISQRKLVKLKAMAEEYAESSSKAEVSATEAEREWTSYQICKYMEHYIGQEFTGTISSVTNFGLYVELENSAEGLVFVNNLKDDYYYFDDTHYTLTGERTGKVYSIGDVITIKLAKVNADLKQMDFVLPEEKTLIKRKTETQKSETRKTETHNKKPSKKGGKRFGGKNKTNRPKQKGKA